MANLSVMYGLVGLLVLFGAVVGWWFYQLNQSARDLKKRFASLGTAVGRTFVEIEAVVGKPDSIIWTGEEMFSCSWNTQNYYVTLEFKDDICERITSEIVV